ncbi:MAG: hypothetical protein K8U03_01885 [Planctomycetia bacterium]|nr:hypothetical protein [Planctomycetia bacterium]
MTNAPKTEARPPRGLAGDIHRARSGANATAEELREFVRQLRGRSPQEMLGVVAGSSLVRGTVAASVITLIFMVIGTLWPYAMRKMNPVVATKPAVVEAAPAAAAPAAANPAAAPAAGTGAAAATPASGSAASDAGPGSPDVLGKLGIGDTKISDPKKNPLDNSKDDLLKDLK